MRLFLLTALTMCAFAANSVLNRMAILGQGMDPLDFAAVRLASGAVALWMLARARGHRLGYAGRGRASGGAALLTYMLGFSLAYLALDAGVGALILFGGVQVTMFAGAVIGGDRLPARRWLGAMLAMTGLGWLFWPQAGGAGVALLPALSMAAAALGWGLYSLVGRGEADPLAATAANFVLAAPLAAAAALALPGLGGDDGQTAAGTGLALLSGIVTSGMGYALWYRILPRLGATRAAVAQLTVPLIAAAGGMAFMAERPGAAFALAALLVIGGVALSLLPGRAPLKAPAGRPGSAGFRGP
jgi:drug/metabolite transporter (DMT)-like permease